MIYVYDANANKLTSRIFVYVYDIYRLNHTIIRAASVCVFVPYVLRGRLTDLRQTWWVYVGWPPICPWGVLFWKGRRVDGSTDHFRFPLYYICTSLMPHAATAPFAFAAVPAAECNSAPFARRVLHCISTVYVGGPWGVLFLKGQRVDGSTGQWVKRVDGRRVKRVDGSHLDGLCRWTSQLPLRGSFSKRSTGRRVNESNGSTGQRVTFTFTILYMIADDARLTPPRCKKHTAYDDTRLTPHLDG